MNKLALFGLMFALFTIYSEKSEAAFEKNDFKNWNKDLGTTHRSIFDPREEGKQTENQGDDSLSSENDK